METSKITRFLLARRSALQPSRVSHRRRFLMGLRWEICVLLPFVAESNTTLLDVVVQNLYTRMKTKSPDPTDEESPGCMLVDKNVTVMLSPTAFGFPSYIRFF